MADTPTALLGLRTVSYAAPQLKEAAAWYTRFLGFAPYFEEPFYVGFNVGGYELGLDPDATPATGSTNAYWGVAEIGAAKDHALAQGATLISDITEVGGGIKVCTVADPFGNHIGLIENPHFTVGS